MIKTNPLVFSLNSNNPFKANHLNKNKIDSLHMRQLEQVHKLAFPTNTDFSDKDIARKRAVKLIMGFGRKKSNKSELDKLKFLNLGSLLPDEINKKKGNLFII